MQICLNDGWRLHDAPLSWDKNALPRVLAAQEGWMPCALPCDIHTPLEAAGRIKDVSKADYCYGAEWTEQRSWWFVKTFNADAATVNADVVELTLESLDAHADVFLNGEWLGTHISAHYPFTHGVKGRVREGENTLAVRMTTGLETVSDADLAEVNRATCTEEANGYPDRGDRRRAFLRKPQYCVGWDWAPRAVTCGIVKNVYLNAWNKVALRSVHVVTDAVEEGRAKLRVLLEVDQLHPYATRDGAVRVSFTLDGRTQTYDKEDILLTSGINYIEMPVELDGARLWWPNGCGEQTLYTVEASVTCEDAKDEWKPFRFGVRTVSLDISRVDNTHRNFFIVVNGVRVFCKGGDWIPADSIYARITDYKYETLVREAKRANFNMLRVWGGGFYERDTFYECCDREGIMIWHDFMFGCSAVPDHLDWFQRETESEMDYQTRRLRNHAAIVLWCGSNEQHSIFNPTENPQWGLEGFGYEKQFGLYACNEIAPRVCRRNCPETPYWNGSPYGGDVPSAENIGDTHHWGCMMNREMKMRIEPEEYDKVGARFVTEYGYPGPCPEASMLDFFDGQPIDRRSRVWHLHNNSFEKDTVVAGIEKHYLENGKDISLQDYILYAGMVQGTMLGYSLEALRFKDFCAGGLFWMYNDTWCEVGWTIIDYYLRRKISFYGVKRAFEPIKLTLRKVNGKAVLQSCNDTPGDITFTAKVGVMALDGTRDETAAQTFTLRARSRAYIGTYDLPEADYTENAFVAVPVDADCAPAVLRLNDAKRMKYIGAAPTELSRETKNSKTEITLTASAFIHGVYLPTDAAMSDNYFDLLPGQIKRVFIDTDAPLPCWKSLM